MQGFNVKAFARLIKYPELGLDIMFSLNIQNDKVSLKDIRPVHLPSILRWYNQVDDFKFATGIDKPITFEAFRHKYAEVAICSNEFFAGIYRKKDDMLIGILKGSVQSRKDAAIWISSIVIDPGFQNRGYGSSSIGLLLEFFKSCQGIRTVYLAVIEDNRQGIRFWVKHDFTRLRIIKNHFKLQDRACNVIIMQKKI